MRTTEVTPSTAIAMGAQKPPALLEAKAEASVTTSATFMVNHPDRPSTRETRSLPGVVSPLDKTSMVAM